MSRFILTKVVALALVVTATGSARADDPKPTLYLVSIGVTKFTHKPFERGVQFAAKDARDVAALFKKQEGKVFGRVECRLLTDAAATRSNVEKAMAWLKSKATKESQVIVFLAGHGGPDPLGQYEYLPHDAHPLLPSTHVTGQMLRDTLQKIPGQRLLMLDTCHAGGFAGKDAEFITLASCSAKETSGEMISTQNGYFTNVLLDGLSGKADKNNDGVVTIEEVESFVKGRLSNLTAGKQSVTMHGASHLPITLPLVQSTTPEVATTGALKSIDR